MSSTAARHPFRIFPPAQAAGAGGPMDLVLETSAFGGGTHPTTVSCLEELAAVAPLTGLRVLDLGSGSGILGIAALRLGAAGAVCVDVNPDAVASARRNGAANGAAERLEHRCASAGDLAGERFDLVVANIGGELLLDEAARIAPLARPGGRLLLSGLLRGWADELERAYARLGCRVVARRSPGEFCTVLLVRR
ncbi:50S ribosomal protein L11 methyltransferase [Anaeromyxobacter sp. Fw109-5]|uniref:50S ribosomal protein L11 methyltransferase n=1 Tax=Anaeromyxobacter sp. (strain Fw109-5) TaxID=404589 RepID=UPI0000ED8A20|nr:50S ribosomal protein L11 methyltransferase [Anaeromyxobacter sp. Fw109-5]ABS27347.1 ribosomal L11 methyltransferase [Anaeromyxobacter sp. Fw109-5]